MKKEVDSAAAFIAALLTKHVDSDFLEFFQFQIEEELKEKYKDHWHVCNSNRGSAYRAINIQYKKIDQKILAPLTRSFICINRLPEQEAKMEASKLSKHFPQELTMWIDPQDVSYRIGDHGSIGVIYSGTSNAVTSDEYNISSSSSSSASSSPCTSPSPSHIAGQQFQQHHVKPTLLPQSIPYQYLYPPPQRQCRQQAFVQSQNHEGLLYL